MYPKVKVRALEIDDDYECSGIPVQDFGFLSIRDYSPPEKERKFPSVAKVPRSYIPRSVTPPPSLPKAAKKCEKQADDNDKLHTRASSIPRPRAVLSSPENDQLLRTRNKTRLERPSAIRSQNTTECRNSAQSKLSKRWSSPSNTVRKSLKAAEAKDISQACDIAKLDKGSAAEIRVPNAYIVKAKPCFTIT